MPFIMKNMNKSEYLKTKLPWIPIGENISNREIASILWEKLIHTTKKYDANYLERLIEQYIWNETVKNNFLQKVKRRTLSQKEYNVLIKKIFWSEILAGYNNKDKNICIDLKDIWENEMAIIKQEVIGEMTMQNLYPGKYLDFKPLASRNFSEQKWFWFLDNRKKGIFFHISKYYISTEIDQNDTKKRILSGEKIVPLSIKENDKWLSAEKRCFENDVPKIISEETQKSLKKKIESNILLNQKIIHKVFDEIDPSDLTPGVYKITWIDKEICFSVTAKYNKETNKIFFLAAAWWSNRDEIIKKSAEFDILPWLKFTTGRRDEIENVVIETVELLDKMCKRFKERKYLYKSDFKIYFDWTEIISGIEKLPVHSYRSNESINIINEASLLLYHPDTIFKAKDEKSIIMKLWDLPEVTYDFGYMWYRVREEEYKKYGQNYTIELPALYVDDSHYIQWALNVLIEYFNYNKKQEILTKIKEYISNDFYFKWLLEKNQLVTFTWWIEADNKEYFDFPFSYASSLNYWNHNQEKKYIIPLISFEDIKEIRDVPEMKMRREKIKNEILKEKRKNLLMVKVQQRENQEKIEWNATHILLDRFIFYNLQEQKWGYVYGKWSAFVWSYISNQWIYDRENWTLLQEYQKKTDYDGVRWFTVTRYWWMFGPYTSREISRESHHKEIGEWMEEVKDIKIAEDYIIPVLPLLNEYPELLGNPKLVIDNPDIAQAAQELFGDNPNKLYIITNASNEYKKMLVITDVLAKKKIEEDRYFTTHAGKEIEKYDELSRRFEQVCLQIDKISTNSYEYKGYSEVSGKLYELMDAARKSKKYLTIDDLEDNIHQLEVIINQILLNYAKRQEKIQVFLAQWVENVLNMFYKKHPLFWDFIKEHQINISVQPSDGDQKSPYLIVIYSWTRRNRKAHISLDDENPLLSLGSQIDQLSKSIDRFLEQKYMVKETDPSDEDSEHPNKDSEHPDIQENNVGDTNWNVTQERAATEKEIDALLGKFWCSKKNKKRK